MPPRDSLKKKPYFDTFLKEDLEDIQMFEESLANGEIEEDRIDSIQDEILRIQIEDLIAKYSRGDSLPALRRDIETMLDRFCEFWDGGIYEDNLCIASLAYLLGLDEPAMNRIREKLTESDTYDGLIEFVLTGNETSLRENKISFPKPYKNLTKAIIDHDRDALLKYLRGWYKGSKESSWYDTHKIKDDNLYFGYWCFEAAATSKRLAFDDQDLKNEPYYPYDLAQKT